MPKNDLVKQSNKLGTYFLSIDKAAELSQHLGIELPELDSIMLSCGVDESYETLEEIGTEIDNEINKLTCDVINSLLKIQTLCLTSTTKVSYNRPREAFDSEVIIREVLALHHIVDNDINMGLVFKALTKPDMVGGLVVSIKGMVNRLAHSAAWIAVERDLRVMAMMSEGITLSSKGITAVPADIADAGSLVAIHMNSLSMLTLMSGYWDEINKHLSEYIPRLIDRPELLYGFMCKFIVWKINASRQWDNNCVILNPCNRAGKSSTAPYVLLLGKQDAAYQRLKTVISTNSAGDTWAAIRKSPEGIALLAAYIGLLNEGVDRVNTLLREHMDDLREASA